MSPDPAPLGRRIPAFLFDQGVVLALVVPQALAVGISIEELLRPGQMRTTIFLILMAIAFVYHFSLEWVFGTTFGKRLFGLAVVADDGTQLDVWESLVRNAFRLLDGLGYWSVATIVILYRGDGKRIGDVAGRTLVVESSESSETEVDTR